MQNGCFLAVTRAERARGRAAQASCGAAGRPGSLSSEGAASGLREGCFPRGGARPAHRCTCGMRGGRGVSFERPTAPRARLGGRALAPGRFPSRGDSVRSRERVARTAPLMRDLCRAGGAGHWQALFRWLPCPAGLFGGRKLGHGVRLDRARALSRGRILGLSPLAGRSVVAPGLPKGVKGMALALRAALICGRPESLFSCDEH